LSWWKLSLALRHLCSSGQRWGAPPKELSSHGGAEVVLDLREGASVNIGPDVSLTVLAIEDDFVLVVLDLRGRDVRLPEVESAAE
jgi:hypothetical protein